MTTPTVSVIVNTLNRADALETLLGALESQTMTGFEVVVVTGPCTDHTEDVVAARGATLKHRRCPEANLSVSRNIGLAAAAGEVVAFIDDDAIPEPSWLAELVAPFADPEVAATGGFVWDHTGFVLQCRFNAANRFGDADFDNAEPLDALCVPGAWRFPYVPGGNSAWSRRHLIGVGGFDENYEYFLDEVDVCVRLIDAGWRLHQVAGAEIHHKFLPSHLRNERRAITDRYPVVKNKLLFGMLNARNHRSLTEILARGVEFCEEHLVDIVFHQSAGNLTADDRARGEEQIERAWEVALEVGLRGGRLPIPAEIAAQRPGSLNVYPTRVPVRRRRRYCFVTQTLPPAPIGGIGRYMLDAARGLAAQGHEVRIITAGSGQDTIDLEAGVWVHRLVDGDDALAPTPEHLGPVPERIWRRCCRVAEEVDRLDRIRPIDAVYGAVRDVETLAVAERSPVPIVLTLVTSLAITMTTCPTWAEEAGFVESFATPMIELERRSIRSADLVHGLSEAIVTEVEATSELSIPVARRRIAPLGAADTTGSPEIDPEYVEDVDDEAPGCTILFVGRFEKRKGIDLLLEALASVLAERPATRARLIGLETLPGPDGLTWVEWIDARHPAASWRDRLLVEGEVDDAVLAEAYRTADLFVAPSRFESFGLIYVEAMSAGLPVVALDLGAAREVLDPSVTGRLVDDDPAALAAALLELVDDPLLRRRLGDAGRERYEAHFTLPAMVERVGLLLDAVDLVRSDDPPWSHPGDTGVVVGDDGRRFRELGAATHRASFDEPLLVDLVVRVLAGDHACLVVATESERRRVALDGPPGWVRVRFDLPTSSVEVHLESDASGLPPASVGLAGVITTRPEPAREPAVTTSTEP